MKERLISSHNELARKTARWQHPKAFFLRLDRVLEPPVTVFFVDMKVKGTVELNVK